MTSSLWLLWNSWSGSSGSAGTCKTEKLISPQFLSKVTVKLNCLECLLSANARWIQATVTVQPTLAEHIKDRGCFDLMDFCSLFISRWPSGEVKFQHVLMSNVHPGLEKWNSSGTANVLSLKPWNESLQPYMPYAQDKSSVLLPLKQCNIITANCFATDSDIIPANAQIMLYHIEPHLGVNASMVPLTPAGWWRNHTIWFQKAFSALIAWKLWYVATTYKWQNPNRCNWDFLVR